MTVLELIKQLEVQVKQNRGESKVTFSNWDNNIVTQVEVTDLFVDFPTEEDAMNGTHPFIVLE